MSAPSQSVHDKSIDCGMQKAQQGQHTTAATAIPKYLTQILSCRHCRGPVRLLESGAPYRLLFILSGPDQAQWYAPQGLD